MSGELFRVTTWSRDRYGNNSGPDVRIADDESSARRIVSGLKGRRRAWVGRAVKIRVDVLRYEVVPREDMSYDAEGA